MKLARVENAVKMEFSTDFTRGDKDYLNLIVNGLCHQRDWHNRHGNYEMGRKAQHLINTIATY